MSVSITTLGTVGVSAGSRSPSTLPVQRLRFSLLVYLAVERDVARDTVLNLFWGNRDPGKGRHALRQMLYELRQVLGEEWIEVRKDRLIVAGVTIDAVEFVSAIASGRRSDALKLYGGGFLHGFSIESRAFETWADRKRAEYAVLHRRVRKEHLAELVEASDWGAALTAARRWTEVDPLDDEAAHALIERLALSGHRAEALSYYESFTRQLAADLEVEPIDDTKALIERIRSGEVIEESVREESRESLAALHRTERLVLQTADSSPAAAVVEPAVAQTPPIRLTTHEARSAPTDLSHPPRHLVAGRFALRRAHLAGAACVVIIFALLALADRTAPSTSPTDVTRVAVAAFEDQTGGQLAPLAEALTEHVVHSLAQSSAIEVLSPHGFAFARANGTAEDSIGRFLGADFIVAGSVHVEDPGWVRVGVEFLEARTGRVIRSTFVDRPDSESRVVLGDVVERLATFLRREVGDQAMRTRAWSETDSEEAWRLLLRARSLEDGRARLSRSGEWDALDRVMSETDSLLARAAQLDPDWIEPVLQRGWLLRTRASYARLNPAGNMAASRALLESALQMVDEAARRDPSDPESFEIRGIVLSDLALRFGEVDSVRLGEAETALRRAVSAEGHQQRSWRGLADVLIASGRWAEAKNAAERAYEIDPYAPETNALVNLLFTTSLEVGEDDAAEAWCSVGRRRFKNELPFLHCLLALHAWADGIAPDPALLRREVESFQQIYFRQQPLLLNRFDAMIATAHARATQVDSARAILDRLATAGDADALDWMRASGYAALGEDVTAIGLLRAYLDRSPVAGLRVARGRAFWRLRGNVEYEQLVGR